MGRTRLPLIVFLCVLAAAAIIAVPATHPVLRRIAYATGILHPVPPLRPGVQFPALAVSDLNGSPRTLEGSAIPGTVIYNVFTSWCPSCRDEAPVFARETQRLKAHGVAIVGIDQGEPADAVTRFTDDFGIRYPILIDTTSASTAILSAHVIPETIVVHDGIVREIAVGPVSAQFLDRAAGV